MSFPQLCRKLTDNNLAFAQYELGYAYLNGIGVTKTPDIGMSWMHKAAANQNIRAKFFVNKTLSTDPKTILKKIKTSKDCFMPEVFPALGNQVRYYCGSTAFSALVNFSNWLDEPLYASLYEKRQARVRDDNHENVVLETLKLTEFSSDGPQFDVNSFQALADAFQIKNCRVIIFPENVSEEEYRKTIFESFKNGNGFIVSFDQENSLPSSRAGQGIHWSFILGSWQAPDGDYKVAANHYGVYCEFSTAELHASNLQLPKINPYVRGGLFDKIRFTLFEMPLEDSGRHFIQRTLLLLL